MSLTIDIEDIYWTTTEYDIPKLLSKILYQARKMTNSDAGSIYVVESIHGDEDKEKKQLRFKTAQNDSISLDLKEFAFDISEKTIAGFVALTGKVVSIDDVYHIPESRPFSFGIEVDRKMGYRTVSMLAFPIKNYRKEVIGVVQLINRKKNFDQRLEPDMVSDHVIPYDKYLERLASLMVVQAGSALENAQLVEAARESCEIQKRLQKEKISAFYDIAAGLSDSLINKLSSILMILEYLREGIKNTGTGAEDLQSLNEDAIREANWVIKTVKQFQRTTDLRAMSVTADIDLHALLIELEREYAGRKFSLCLCEERPRIRCNPQLKECVRGIAENAFESGEDREAEVTVRTRVDASAMTVSTEITDNGQGMDQDKIKRVFTPFYTSKGTTRTGLGLWNCFQIVTLSGGDISITSRPGTGTTVRFTFPLSKNPQGITSPREGNSNSVRDPDR